MFKENLAKRLGQANITESEYYGIVIAIHASKKAIKDNTFDVKAFGTAGQEAVKNLKT